MGVQRPARQRHVVVVFGELDDGRRARHRAVRRGHRPDPQLQQLEGTLHDNGYLGAVRSRRILHDTTACAEALAASYGSVIDSLAAVSGAAPRALWGSRHRLRRRSYAHCRPRPGQSRRRRTTNARAGRAGHRPIATCAFSDISPIPESAQRPGAGLSIPGKYRGSHGRIRRDHLSGSADNPRSFPKSGANGTSGPTRRNRRADRLAVVERSELLHRCRVRRERWAPSCLASRIEALSCAIGTGGPVRNGRLRRTCRNKRRRCLLVSKMYSFLVQERGTPGPTERHT